MNILIISPGYPRWKGDYTHPMVRNAARQLSDAGHQIRVVTIAYPGVPSHEVCEGIEVIRARYAPERLQILGSEGGLIDDIRRSMVCKLLLMPMLMSLTFHILLHARWADLLLVQWIPTAVVALPSKWLFSKPLVLHSRTYADTRFWRLVYRILLPKADGVIYNSGDNQKQTQLVFRHPKTTVIGSGINLTQFENVVQRQSDGVVKIISVARLVEFKGLEYSIRASALLKPRGINAKLTIIGDGPLRKDLEQLIRLLQLQDDVVLTGALPHDEVVEHLFKNDIFVISSIVDGRGRTEGFGAVILEAMAAKLPVIASAVGGIVDIVNDSNGILVPEKDEKAIADAVELLVLQPAKAEMYVRNAWSFVHKFYSDEALTERYTNFFETIAGTRVRA